MNKTNDESKMKPGANDGNKWTTTDELTESTVRAVAPLAGVLGAIVDYLFNNAVPWSLWLLVCGCQRTVAITTSCVTIVLKELLETCLIPM